MKTKVKITESQLKSLKKYLTNPINEVSEDKCNCGDTNNMIQNESDDEVSENGEFRVNTSKHVGPKDREKRKNPITGYDIDSDELGGTIDNPLDRYDKYIKPDYSSFKGKQNRTTIDTRDMNKR